MLAACSGGNDQSLDVVNNTPVTVSGSVGDGPIAGANITVVDSRGDVVLEGTADSTATYQLDVPPSTHFPLTIKATGGTDMVSGQPADFELLAATTSPKDLIVHLTPLSTLAVQSAQCMKGGVSRKNNLDNALAALSSQLSMGLDPAIVPDLMNADLTPTEMSALVYASEGLAEALRRTQAALAPTDAAASLDEIIARLGCDLTDGVIDGSFGSADVRTAMTFNAALAGVSLEMIAHKLEVGGSNAMGAIDAALQTITANAAPSVMNEVPTQAFLNRARQALAVTSAGTDEPTLMKYMLLLDGTTPPAAPQDVGNALTTADLVTFDGLPGLVALADDTALADQATAARDVASAMPPVMSFDASPTQVMSGSASQLSWSVAQADSCVGSGAWSGSKDLDGTEMTAALTADATYTLTCTGLGGSVSNDVTVTVDTTPPAAPTVSLSASNPSVQTGQNVTLSWTSTNATSCSASGGWTGDQPVSGSASVGPLDTATTYTLTCDGAGGSANSSVTVAIQAAPAPTLSFSASPGSVAYNGSSTLTWSSTNATDCSASGDWSGTRPTSGNSSVGPLTATQTYTLACTGSGGTVTRSATVTVAPAPAPTVSLSASPMSIASGDASTLSWSSANTTSCTASGGWSGSKGTSGSESTGALTSNATYMLSCSGPGGSASKSTTVTVVPAPTLTLSASPTAVASGASSTLSWSSTNASSCTASGGWSGAKATSGSQSTGAVTSDGTYTLTCTGTGGSVSKSASVTVAPAPTLSLTASPTTVASGASSSLSWSSTNATSCTASGSWSGSKATSGTQSTGTLTSSGTYTLSCTGSGGSVSKTATVTVAQAPSLTFTASPTSVTSGTASSLSWTATNATSCTASGAWSGSKATSGTQSTGNLTASSTYTLACTGTGGSVTKSATVSVTAGNPSVTLSANPPGVAMNGTTSLSWTGTNVTSCTASGGWSGTKATSGSETVGPITQDTTYSINCSGGGGSAVAMTTVSLRVAQLSWTAPTQNVDGSSLTDLTGYKIYYGTSPQNYTQVVPVSGATTTQWTLNLAPGTYYFALTAVSSTGESAKTNEVSKTIY